ncbi:hypothetical protein C8R44DRAFT_332826 [Mycena epipterygia]|nr:hypothetical protein C8R44DRAFT_332826 [Mycena epipterygia]
MMALSNNPHRGFHPFAQMRRGNPHIARVYDHPPTNTIFTDNLIDDKPYASYDRADLCLKYIYDEETKYDLGGEIVTLPVVTYVYRRDPELRWSEIRTALSGGPIPKRYMSTNTTQDAPMNAATFQKFMNRFYLANDANGTQVIHEKGARLPVERHHADFEWVINVMLPNKFDDDDILAFTAQDLAKEVLEHTKCWHLDRFQRAESHWRDLHHA